MAPFGRWRIEAMHMKSVTPLVFIGGDNSPGKAGSGPSKGDGAYPDLGVVRQFTDGGGAEWPWVLQNIDGWFFAIQQFQSHDDSWMDTIRSWLTNKNAFV